MTSRTQRHVIAGLAGMLAVSISAGAVAPALSAGGAGGPSTAAMPPVAEPALANAVSEAEAAHTAAVLAAEAQRAAEEAARAARTGRQQAVVDLAMSKVGGAYRLGASGPSVFDCSGLTMWTYRNTDGTALPHNTRAQWNAIGDTWYAGQREPQPGDIVFFFNGADHVGIYIGGGKMVHAANPRSGVTVDSIYDGYWGGRLTGFGRIIH